MAETFAATHIFVTLGINGLSTSAVKGLIY